MNDKKTIKVLKGFLKNKDNEITELREDIKHMRRGKKRINRDIDWVIDEVWELSNKPWRFFATMHNFVKKYMKDDSQNTEALAELLVWREWVGKGNNPGKEEREKAFQEAIGLPSK